MKSSLKPSPWGKMAAERPDEAFQWAVTVRLPLGGSSREASERAFDPSPAACSLTSSPRARQSNKQSEASSISRLRARRKEFSGGKLLQASPLGRGGLPRSGKTKRVKTAVIAKALSLAPRELPPRGSLEGTVRWKASSVRQSRLSRLSVCHLLRWEKAHDVCE